MQAQNLTTTHVEKVINTQATAKLATEQKTEQKPTKVKQVEVVETPKPLNSKPLGFSRTLEAYSDCV